MNYVYTTQADMDDSWQRPVYVQNWQDQRNRNYAHEIANNWMPGWTFVDVQVTANLYKVHYRDGHNNYRTVMMDHDFRYRHNQGGYC